MTGWQELVAENARRHGEARERLSRRHRDEPDDGRHERPALEDV